MLRFPGDRRVRASFYGLGRVRSRSNSDSVKVSGGFNAPLWRNAFVHAECLTLAISSVAFPEKCNCRPIVSRGPKKKHSRGGLNYRGVPSNRKTNRILQLTFLLLYTHTLKNSRDIHALRIQIHIQKFSNNFEAPRVREENTRLLLTSACAILSSDPFSRANLYLAVISPSFVFRKKKKKKNYIPFDRRSRCTIGRGRR